MGDGTPMNGVVTVRQACSLPVMSLSKSLLYRGVLSSKGILARDAPKGRMQRKKGEGKIGANQLGVASEREIEPRFRVRQIILHINGKINNNACGFSSGSLSQAKPQCAQLPLRLQQTKSIVFQVCTKRPRKVAIIVGTMW